MVDECVIQDHIEAHAELREDGQQKDYITLPENERFSWKLSDVPQVYRHAKCGKRTGMPEEIIRSYLANPFMYGSDETYCTGCQDHVPNSECNWTETGQNLQEYMDELRAEARARESAVSAEKRAGKGSWLGEDDGLNAVERPRKRVPVWAWLILVYIAIKLIIMLNR